MQIVSREKKYVKRIYVLLFSMLLIDPLLSKFIPITTILRSIELLCFMGVFFYEYKLYKNGCLRKFYRYEKILYIFLFLISIGIIFRGNWPGNPKEFVLHSFKTSLYLLPFFITPLPNNKYCGDILRLFFKVSLFVIPLWIINFGDLVQIGTYKAEGIGTYLPFLSAFLLGTCTFLGKKQRKVNLIIWGIYFLLMMLNARRNVSFSLLLYAFIAFMFSIIELLKKNKIMFFFAVVIATLTGIVLFLNMETLMSGLFKNMAGRMNEDSRSGVEEWFFADFASSPETDWFFGRGMDGGYYQLVTDELTGETTDNRQVIETGYLNMILKGGIVYDIVIVLIMLLAIRRGFAHNERIFIYMTIILCTYFIDLYTTNPVCTFSVRSILFWFMISILSEKYGQKKSVKLG